MPHTPHAGPFRPRRPILAAAVASLVLHACQVPQQEPLAEPLPDPSPDLVQESPFEVPHWREFGDEEELELTIHLDFEEFSGNVSGFCGNLSGDAGPALILDMERRNLEGTFVLVELPSYNALTPEQARVIRHKGTEPAFIGEYTYTKSAGTYVCRQCNAPLYRSSDKFDSDCGWPSFDAEIAGAVTRLPDADGRRSEIVCSNCRGHLGHVFLGERFTAKNTRHCVNSVSLRFVPEGEALQAPIVLNKKP